MAKVTKNGHHVVNDDLAESSSTVLQLTASFWMNGVISAIFVIVGLIGNVSMIISFHCSNRMKNAHGRRQVFYYYLITFASWNSVLLVASVLFNCLPALLANNFSQPASDDFHLWSIFYLVGYLIGNCCVTADSWLAVIVNIERYFAVTRPLRTRITSSRRRAKFICIVTSALAVIYNLPLLFEFSLYRVQYEDVEKAGNPNNRIYDFKNVTWEQRGFLKLYLSPVRDNSVYQILYRVVAHFIFVSIVPFSVVLLLTIRIVCVVRESDRNRSRFRKTTIESRPDASASVALAAKSSAPLARYRQMDLLLTMIAGKFLLFYTLPVAINIAEVAIDPQIFESDDSYEARLLHLLVDLSNLLIVIDGATNSFFYFSWRNRLGGNRSSGWSTQRSTFMMESTCALAMEGQNGNGGMGFNRKRSGSSRANSSLRSPVRCGSFEQCSSWTPE